MREKGDPKKPKDSKSKWRLGQTKECTECVEPEEGPQRDNGRGELSEDHFSDGQCGKYGCYHVVLKYESRKVMIRRSNDPSLLGHLLF